MVAIAYKALCWIVGTLMVLIGVALLGASVLSLTPGSSSALPFPIGPQGYYFVAFSGACLTAWGFCLFGAARAQGGRAIGTATALGLTLGAAFRMLVWLLGDFWWASETPLVEAIVFLLMALAFLWLRPPVAEHPRHMIGRILGTLAIGPLLVLAIALPYTSMGRRGSEPTTRFDVTEAVGHPGETLPTLSLVDLAGRPVSIGDYRGQRVVLLFGRSLDWCPFTKARLIELRQGIDSIDDVAVLFVLPDNQINEKTLLFIAGNRLTDRVTFLQDPFSASIDRLGLRRPNPDLMETGVPHAATYVLDRQGVIRLADIRQDFQIWLDDERIVRALAEIP